MEQRITGLRLIWPDDIALEDEPHDLMSAVPPDIVYTRSNVVPIAVPMPMAATVYGRAARRYAHLAVIDGGAPSRNANCGLKSYLELTKSG